MLNASSARIHITKNMTMRWKTVGIIALFNAVHLKMFVDIVAMSSCEKRVRFRRFWNYLKKKGSIINTSTGKSFSEAGIYRWSIILADTDFFQQSVSAADFRGRNNRPSAKHFFIKLLMNFSWIFDEFLNFTCTLWHCKFDWTLSYSAKVCT